MTGRVIGIVTSIQVELHNDCNQIQIWCGAHQLDLVMQLIMKVVVKERFFFVMTGFISHLTQQQNLIAEMSTMCPCVVNQCFSTDKITTWFKKHWLMLLAYIELKQHASAEEEMNLLDLRRTPKKK